MIRGLPDSLHMEEVIATSFRDYHVKGFDYLCLKRSPERTIKFYFFDGDVSKLPEVVCPHDHRYDFETVVLAGASQNVWYAGAGEIATGDSLYETFEEFEWDTPLVGGTGFKHVGQARLIEYMRATYPAGHRYDMAYDEIHTIKMVENETVLCLIQYADVVNRPTRTFTRRREPPSLEGIYRRFTPDEVLAKIRVLRERVPELELPKII